MSRTNAQAALQAAATIHSTSAKYTSDTTITDLAYRLLTWLDQHEVGK